MNSIWLPGMAHCAYIKGPQHRTSKFTCTSVPEDFLSYQSPRLGGFLQSKGEDIFMWTDNED